MPISETTRSLRRTAPAAVTRSLEEKAGQPETIRSVGRTGFREMIASGRQTAPPQAFEVELVTNSAYQLALEAPPCVPDSSCVATPALFRSPATAGLYSQLAPGIVHLSFRTQRLSALAVSCT